MDPFSVPIRLAKLMLHFGKPWYVTGGWAIDLFLGRVTRPHKDIELAILRQDQSALQEYLTGWDLNKIIPPELGSETWRTDEHLEPPIHEIRASKFGASPAEFEILLNESSEGKWIYRRNPGISLPLTELGRYSDHGIPFLSPVIVLLYKAKQVLEIDGVDFQNVLVHLDHRQRRWLREAIEVCHPRHPWAVSLEDRDT